MKCADAIERVVQYLLPRDATAPELAPQVLAHIAGCQACIAELANISTTLTGELSPLWDQIARLSRCEAYPEELAAYVEDELASRDAAARHPLLARHLTCCADCREQLVQLREIMQLDATGALGLAPSLATSAAQVERQPQPSLWQSVSATLQRLSVEIPVRLEDMRATFGQLPALLSFSQPAPAYALLGARTYRGPDAAEEAATELLELPCPEINLTIKVSLGPVFEGHCNLIVQVHALQPPAPLAHVRVDLLEGSDGLLESLSTDDKGLATLRDLDLGRYTLRIEQAGQQREFSVVLSTRGG